MKTTVCKYTIRQRSRRIEGVGGGGDHGSRREAHWRIEVPGYIIVRLEGQFQIDLDIIFPVSVDIKILIVI